jgi:hypothetical protein
MQPSYFIWSLLLAEPIKYLVLRVARILICIANMTVSMITQSLATAAHSIATTTDLCLTYCVEELDWRLQHLNQGDEVVPSANSGFS